jgi:hypothetical protein
MPDREHRADALHDLERHVVAAALRAKHLLEPALEFGVAVTGGAFPQVPLDLHALDANELPVEVELDLTQHVLAISP